MLVDDYKFSAPRSRKVWQGIDDFLSLRITGKKHTLSLTLRWLVELVCPCQGSNSPVLQVVLVKKKKMFFEKYATGPRYKYLNRCFAYLLKGHTSFRFDCSWISQGPNYLLPAGESLRILSYGDNQMGAKIKTLKKALGLPTKPPQNSWTLI